MNKRHLSETVTLKVILIVGLALGACISCGVKGEPRPPKASPRIGIGEPKVPPLSWEEGKKGRAIEENNRETRKKDEDKEE